MKLLGGYAAFYNPLSFIRALRRDGSKLRRRRIGYQAAGMLAVAWTAIKMVPYAVRLMIGDLKYHEAPPLRETVRVRHPAGVFRRFAQTEEGGSSQPK